MTREVANPEYVELKALLAAARRADSVHGHQLDRAAALMGEGRAWSGPGTASVFAAEVEAHKGQVSARSKDFIRACPLVCVSA